MPSLLKKRQSIYLHASLQKKKCARALVPIRNIINIIYIYTYSIHILQRKMSQAPGACRYHCCFRPSFSSRMPRPTSRTNKMILSYVHVATLFSLQRENTHHLNHASATEKHRSHICSCFSLNPAPSTTPWLLGRCSSAVTSTSRQMRIDEENP